MHLKKLWISNFKNLKDFTINFNEHSFYDIIIGKNGSGKSNLFEALIGIFESLRDNSSSPYDFELEYLINGSDHKIEFKKGKLNYNGEEVGNIPNPFLPDNILIYYSGHNKRISDLISSYEDKYRGSIKSYEPKDIRFLLGINEEHKNILLLLLLLLDNQNEIYNNIVSKLKLETLNSEIKFILKKPFYYDKKLDAWDETTKFWNIKGYLNTFLKTLETKESKGGQHIRDEGYFSKQEKYYFYIKLADLQSVFQSLTPMVMFQYLDDLRVIGMLDELSFNLKLKSGETITSHELSDGEIQTIFFNSTVELFRDLECIVLLDEPDAFLHPEWQTLLLEQLNTYLLASEIKCNVLISSHCASTVVQSLDKNIKIFQNDEKVNCISIPKFVAVSKLSGGKYYFDTNTQIINILHQIKTEDKSVLIVEGFTDHIILEKAWTKLKEYEMPFLIYYTFGSSQVKSLILDDKVYNETKIKPIFALFDFDKAYQNWNDIKGDLTQISPMQGLTKKVKDKESYVMLLPVPENPRIKRQTIRSDGSNKTFGDEARLTIELMFYGPTHLDQYFDTEECVGGGERVFFKGDKDGFARKVVPTLPSESFKVFEPIFNFIESKIQ